MPLGDSITEGGTPALSYRFHLDSLLHRGGYPFDFVGSLHGTHYDTAAATTWDSDHDGHFAWEAWRILPQIGGWARTYRPDIVLMHLGTNDIIHYQPADTMTVVNSTIGVLGAIIDTLRSVNPQIAVFIAQIIPDVYGSNRRFFDSLNTRIPTLAATKSTLASPVIVVDQNTGFNWATDLDDSYHPNASGASKMAAKWYAALDTYFKSSATGTQSGAPNAWAPTAVRSSSRNFTAVSSGRPSLVCVATGALASGPVNLLGRSAPLPRAVVTSSPSPQSLR
jgi:lysophospholipase L1-like esterase